MESKSFVTKENFEFIFQMFGLAIKLYAIIQYREGFEKNVTSFETNSKIREGGRSS